MTGGQDASLFERAEVPVKVSFYHLGVFLLMLPQRFQRKALATALHSTPNRR